MPRSTCGRVLGWCSAVALLAACSSGKHDSNMDAPGATGSGGASAAPGSGGNGASSMMSATTGGSSAPAPMGGSGGQMAATDAGGNAPGGGSGSDASTMHADAGPTECDGKPLPPRAIGTPGPYAIGPDANGLETYWPTDDWRTKDPAELGFDPDKLTAAAEFSTQYSNTEAMLIIRHGYVAYEGYPGTTQMTRHESYSMAKSFSSALIGIAIDEGLIPGVDEKVCTYYPDDWDCSDTSDPRSRITIDHVLSLKTGLEWHEDWRSNATGTNDAYNANLLDYTLSRPGTMEPGTEIRYSTGDPSLLSGILQKATGMTALAYAQAKIFNTIGTPGITWNSDLSGRTTTYAGLQATAREYAKFAYLYLNHGEWDGMQVVPGAWVDKSVGVKDACHDWVHYCWHINLPVRLGKQDPACPEMFCQPTELANLPPDGFFQAGVNGQLAFVIPSADLVVVRLASDSPGVEHWDAYAVEFLGKLLDAIN